MLHHTVCADYIGQIPVIGKVVIDEVTGFKDHYVIELLSHIKVEDRFVDHVMIAKSEITDDMGILEQYPCEP